MKKQISILFLVTTLLIGGAWYWAAFESGQENRNREAIRGNDALAAQFEYLSENGKTSCSLAFREGVQDLPPGERLQGSCCSPMSLHRYEEQIEGLQKFKVTSGQSIDKIPDDPYDIDAGLAKELMSYYDIELTQEEQEAYDYAMANSHEKGPCCCKCWRWYVYGGLGKYLIRNHGFTGEQLTEVWNLSDGCGGDSEHHH